MIVARWTQTIKDRRTSEYVALLREMFGGIDRPVRISTCYIGPERTVALEIEFESLEQYEKSRAEWRTTPEAATFLERRRELIDGPGNHGIWVLHQ